MTRPTIAAPTQSRITSIFSDMMDLVADVAPELHELLESENLLGLGDELESARDADYEGYGMAHANEFFLLAAKMITVVGRIRALALAEGVPFFAEDPEMRDFFIDFAGDNEDDDYDLREHAYNFIASRLAGFAETLADSAIGPRYDFDFSKAETV